MSSVFTKIISGEIPSYKVAEDEHFLAFLDVSPIAKGHTLVIPKQEIDYVFDIESTQYADFWLFAKKVARKLEKAIECKRIGVAVVGLEVPHAHIHLVPINAVSDINFSKPKLKLSAEEMKETAESIRNS